MHEPTLIALRREPGALTRSLTALILRLTLGLALLMYGVHKFAEIRAGKYPASMNESFRTTWLGQQFPDAVRLFSAALPYTEVVLGALLIVGFLTTIVAFLAGLQLVALLFGLLVMAGNNPGGGLQSIPPHLIYVLTSAAVLWLSPVWSNWISVDGLIFGWFWRPEDHGRFRRDAGPSPPGRSA